MEPSGRNQWQPTRCRPSPCDRLSGLGLLWRLRPLPAPSADGGPAHRRPGRPAGRATLGGFPRSPCTGWRGRCPAVALQPRHGYAADLPRGLRTGGRYADREVAHQQVMACAAGRPTSARLEPVHSLEGVRPLVHVVVHLPALLAGPGPSGGAGPSRRCRAAPALPCASRVRLPPASPACCDRPEVGSCSPPGCMAPRGARRRRCSRHPPASNGPGSTACARDGRCRADRPGR